MDYTEFRTPDIIEIFIELEHELLFWGDSPG